jgi:hypothetical protein
MDAAHQNVSSCATMHYPEAMRECTRMEQPPVLHFLRAITLVEMWAADEWHANLVPARAEQRCASAPSERAALPLDDVRVPDSTRTACIAAD